MNAVSSDTSVVKVTAIAQPSGTKVPGGTLTGMVTVVRQGAGTATVTVTAQVGLETASATIAVTAN